MKIFQPTITGSFVVTGSATITGSLNVTDGITGSISGYSSGTGTSGAIVKFTGASTIGDATVDVDYLQQDMSLIAMQAMGSSIDAYNLMAPIPPMNANVTLAMTSGTCHINAIYLPKTTTLTGIRWYHGNTPSFTANNYNGVALYSNSGGTLTLVASSTNDGNCFQQGTGWRNKDFSSPATSLSRGIYYIAILASWSASVTIPQMMSHGASAGALATISSFDFTSNKIYGGFASQTSLPSSPTIGNFNANSSRFIFYAY